VRIITINTLPVGARIAIIDTDNKIYARGTIMGPQGKWGKHVVLDVNEYKPVGSTRITDTKIRAIIRGGKGKLGAIRL